MKKKQNQLAAAAKACLSVKSWSSILVNSHPADNIVCQAVHGSLVNTAKKCLENQLAVPKSGLFVVKLSWSLDKNFTKLVWNRLDWSKQSISVRKGDEASRRHGLRAMAELIRETVGLQIDLVMLNINLYEKLTTLVVDTRLLQYFPRRIMLQGCPSFVNVAGWAKAINAIVDRCAASLRHFVFLEGSPANLYSPPPGVCPHAGKHVKQYKHSQACCVPVYNPAAMHRELQLDHILAKASALRTVYLPNLCEYECAVTQSTVGNGSTWPALDALSAKLRLASLKRIVLPTTKSENLQYFDKNAGHLKYFSRFPDLPAFTGKVQVGGQTVRVCVDTDGSSLVDYAKEVKKLNFWAYHKPTDQKASGSNVGVVMFDPDKQHEEAVQRFGFRVMDYLTTTDPLQTTYMMMRKLKAIEEMIPLLPFSPMPIWRELQDAKKNDPNKNAKRLSRKLNLLIHNNNIAASFDRYEAIVKAVARNIRLNLWLFDDNEAGKNSSNGLLNVFSAILPVFDRRRFQWDVVKQHQQNTRLYFTIKAESSLKQLLASFERRHSSMNSGNIQQRQRAREEMFLVPQITVKQSIWCAFKVSANAEAEELLEKVRIQLLKVFDAMLADAVDCQNNYKNDEIVQYGDYRKLIYGHIVCLKFGMGGGFELNEQQCRILEKFLIDKVMTFLPPTAAEQPKYTAANREKGWMKTTVTKRVPRPFPMLKSIKIINGCFAWKSKY